MYLLMLLATFMSAIYGYNLSIRPDYDRDIPHKKALAVAYKFSNQHRAAKTVALNAAGEAYTSDGLLWLMPGDLIYADGDAAKEDKQALILKQGEDEHSILVRKADDSTGGTSGSNIMRIGRTLFADDVMVSQVICPDMEIDENNVHKKCSPTTDSEGNVTGTCCGDAKAYFISYRILDARWLNRLTNQVNSDFMWAISKKSYSENIGVVNWDSKQSAWIFTGKIKLYAVYRKDKEAWMADKDADALYPTAKTQRTHWVLPNRVFDRDFFKDKGGHNMCENGCLVKIEEI